MHLSVFGEVTLSIFMEEVAFPYKEENVLDGHK